MPQKIVDLSARSSIIRDEPWHLHFWESTPAELLSFFMNPRGELERMGISLPKDCRIETTVENHDWIAGHTKFAKDNGPIIICGTGGGNIAKNYYKVAFYGHKHADIGHHKKELLHSSSEEQRKPR